MLTLDSFITSDHHFGHASIAHFEPMRQQLLGEDWEKGLIARHNSVVSPTDTVLFLGDFSFLDPLRYSPLLNGHKLLILGNHDRKGLQPYRDFAYVQNGITVNFDGHIFTQPSDDLLLSAYIQTMDGQRLGFCHYTPGYHDIYDDQRESAMALHNRKMHIDEIFTYFGVTTVLHGHLHSRPQLSPGKYRYINCCLEHHNMMPQRLGDLL